MVIAAGKFVRDIAWPEGSLIVGIRRGDKEMIPRANTQILPGDYLVILSSETVDKDISIRVKEICQTE